MLYIFLWLLGSITLISILSASARYLGKEIFPALLAGSLVTAIFVAGKLGDVTLSGIWTAAISASIIVYSMTFLLTDTMSELYWKDFTRRAIIGTALCYPIVYITTQLSINWEPSQFYTTQEGFASIMGMAGRITLASICSFSVSQLFDVWAFDKIKEKTKGKYLWLRNNWSTMWSQLIDTVMFYSIAFIGILPTEVLVNLIIVTYIFKLFIALLDTPFVYLVTNFIRSGDKK